MTGKPSLNIGILGFAHSHVDGYLKMWQERPDLKISAVAGWDHDSGRLAQSAVRHGVAVCESAEAVLGRRDIDFVIIAAETSLHADLVEMAAAAGKGIILQKPIAIHLHDADRIAAAVKKAGVPFTIAWQMRVDPQNIQIRDMLAGRRFGKVYFVRRRHGLSLHNNAGFARSWHIDPALNRDIWADDASHPIDFIHWLLGCPDTVTAEMITASHEWLRNDNGVALFRYAGGPLAEVACSFTCAAAENTTEVYAEHGIIIQSFGDVPGCAAPRIEGRSGLKWRFTAAGTWEYSDIPSPVDHFERICGLAAPLAEFMHGRRAAIAGADEARVSLRMTLATYVSSREGRRVSLDDSAIDQE